MTTKTTAARPKRNPIAKAVRKIKPQIIPDKKTVYSRKKKDLVIPSDVDIHEWLMS